MDRRTLIVSGLATLGAAGAAKAQEPGQNGPYQTPTYPASPPAYPNQSYPNQTYPNPGEAPAEPFTREEMVNNVSDFLGVTAEAAGGAIERVFRDNGRPTAYIAGQEASGAISIGARYGKGLLYMKNREPLEVYWQGPSVGWDLGGNASRVFTLCYNLQYPEILFQRFPGVEGTAYLVGGLGVNYLQSDEVILAPIRAGVGLRLGANIGYLGFSRKRRTWPF